MIEAKATDWTTKPLPARRATISVERSFSPAEMERIRRGLIPEQMEDKWLIYWQDDTLYLHRSWTGICIYAVRFAREEDGSGKVVQVEVNRDPKQYSGTSDANDASVLAYLIDVLLLRKQAEFPTGAASVEESALPNWSLVGRAMLGQHPDDEGDS